MAAACPHRLTVTVASGPFPDLAELDHVFFFCCFLSSSIMSLLILLPLTKEISLSLFLASSPFFNTCNKYPLSKVAF